MKKLTKVQAIKEAKLVAAKLAAAKLAAAKAVAKAEKPVAKKAAAKAVAKAEKPVAKKAAAKAVAKAEKPVAKKAVVKVVTKAEKPAAKKVATSVPQGPRIVKREAPAMPEVPATKKKPAIPGAPAKTVWEFAIAGVTAPVDPLDLCRTLGCARWGNGSGLVDAWPAEVWEACLKHLGLPAEPLNRAVARFPVLRLVQAAWSRQFGGIDPDSAECRRKDAATAAAYLRAFEGVMAASESAKAGAIKARATKGETEYAPADALKSVKVGGQATTLLAFFKAEKWAPTTTFAAAEGMVKHGLVTSTKPARIAAFYLCQWVKKGWLVRR